MIMRYEILKNHASVFLSVTGLRASELDALFDDMLPQCMEAERQRLERPDRQRAIGAGEPPSLDARDQLLGIVWLRLYPTNEVLGYLFGVRDWSVSRYVQRVVPVLEQAGRDTMRLPDPGRKRRKHLDQLLNDIPELVVVIDSFEQRVQRPTDRHEQQGFYSGKKKLHTLKSQITVDEETGHIVDVSDSVPGPTADINLLDQSHLLERLPDGLGAIGDAAYQGLAKRHANGHSPRKKPQARPARPKIAPTITPSPSGG